MKKLAKAVSYFLTGEYDKIMEAEEAEGEVDMNYLVRKKRKMIDEDGADVDEWLDSNLKQFQVNEVQNSRTRSRQRSSMHA